MALSLRIAARYLFARKSHAAVNIISMVSMAGIALATAAMVVVLSVFNGFHSLIESRLSVLDAPLTVVPSSGKIISNVDSLCEALTKLSAIEAALPQIEEQALAIGNGHQMAVKLRGVTKDYYQAFDSICPAGNPWQDYHPVADPGVLAVGVANELRLPVAGEQLLYLYVPKRKGRINPANPMGAFRTDSVAPSALFVLNQQETDRDVVYAPFDKVARMLQLTDAASTIGIYPRESVTDALRQVRALLPDSVKVLTLLERQSGSFQVVNMEKWMTFMLLGFILLIASFNVISSLSLLIIEKEPNAGILSALGATDSMIKRIYRLEGVLITGIGTVVGLVLGTLLSIGQEHFGWVKFAGDVSRLTVTAYPVEFHAVDLVPVAMLAVIIGVATSLIATRKA